MNQNAEALREQLEHLRDAERTIPLLRLGQIRLDEYWRAGPGNPGALPALNAAVQAFDEAYGYIDPADTLRGTVAATLGWLLGARSLAHAGPPRDRDTGIHVLREALSFPSLTGPHRTGADLMLGQLHMSRVTAAMNPTDMASAMRGGTAPGDARDADLAVECFRRVADGTAVNTEMRDMARMMLEMAEALQSLMGGFGKGLGGFDLSRMADMVTVMQRVQQQGGRFSARPGIVPFPSLFDAERAANDDPLIRPVAVVEHGDLPAPVVPRPRTPVEPDDDAARRKLRALAGDLGTLLAGDRSGVDVDELVALAATAVHASGDAHDHLVLAVALHLRDDGDDDRAAEHLATAAAGPLPGDDQPAVVALAARLHRPDLAAVALAPAAGALRAIGADALALPGLTLHASGEPTPARDVAGRVLTVGDGPWSVAGIDQLVTLAARKPPPVTDDPVFVADPRGDHEPAGVEAMLLRRIFYPRSTGLGRTIEYIDAAGTADDVRAHLNGSLLHLACGITPAGALELANGTELPLTQLPPVTGAGLVVLHPPRQGTTPATLRIADQFLTAGFTGVVTWRHPVPDPVAALMLFILHTALVQDGLPAHAAVGSVRAWLADPTRATPDDLPTFYASAATTVDLTDPAFRSALIHRGIA
ncbi:hypothetical protein [Dactylosporangium sp. NPDC005555]|uniref:hypothetical protein n=1 Tax=Dactylosporangium sp. NPDC005555 TaxID=3154889 RepID=UPI0033A7801B